MTRPNRLEELIIAAEISHSLWLEMIEKIMGEGLH